MPKCLKYCYQILAVLGMVLPSVACTTTENASGSVNRNAILEVLRLNKPGIIACYNDVQKRRRSTIIIEWDIGTGGRVVRTRVESNDMDSDQPAVCLRELISGLLFPEPKEGEINRVRFPFIFVPSSD